MFASCDRFELEGKVYPIDPLLIEDLKEECDELSADGFRVLAVAYKDMERRAAYSKDDEQRPDPQGLRGLPRPAQGNRGAGHPGPAEARRSRSRSSPATTSW